MPPRLKCMAGLSPTKEDVIALKIPFGMWESDTLIVDSFGNPIFSVLELKHHSMGAYEAIFGDQHGNKLCFVKRRLITKMSLDGWDFCTYQPNFPNQPKYKERDIFGKSVYPYSFLEIQPMRCRYAYSVHKQDMQNMEVQLEAMHGWLGSMTVCCTPMVRFGKWTIDFHQPGVGDPELNIDQSRNLLQVERGNDLLAALCIAYAFDKALCTPMITIIGYTEKEHGDDNSSDKNDDDNDDDDDSPPAAKEKKNDPSVKKKIKGPPMKKSETKKAPRQLQITASEKQQRQQTGGENDNAESKVRKPAGLLGPSESSGQKKRRPKSGVSNNQGGGGGGGEGPRTAITSSTKEAVTNPRTLAAPRPSSPRRIRKTPIATQHGRSGGREKGNSAAKSAKPGPSRDSTLRGNRAPSNGRTQRK